MSNKINIALVGNPNSGKTSLFNELTGLNQKVGNFPGVTVDKKSGYCRLSEALSVTITDLPGTYSLYPKRADEWVAYKVLLQRDEEVKPDMILLVADASNLRRNLLFCSQIVDLKIPVVLVLTMMDLAREKGMRINTEGLSIELGVPVVVVNPRKKRGIEELKKQLLKTTEKLGKTSAHPDFIYNSLLAPRAIEEIQQLIPGLSQYKSIHYLINHESLELSPDISTAIEGIEKRNKFNPVKTQAEEIIQRYARIRHITNEHVQEEDPQKKSRLSEKIDKVLLHRVWGYLILLTVLFVLFQSVFWIANYPMSFIETGFGWMSTRVSETLQVSWWSDLLVNGVLAGLSGILIFVPQIMILFGLITLLEDSGYMARISFLTDKLMRKAGLNGKSVMPMISGYACAVPAIMSARNIENKKERLLTIMITPFMSCSARLPVYNLLVALVIPGHYYFGFISLQGLVMMGLYLFGTVMAITLAWVLKWFIASTERSYFILELPVYRNPRWKNMIFTMVEKAKVFVVDAGKVIMLISLILWALSYYGPRDEMPVVKKKYDLLLAQNSGDIQFQLKRDRAKEMLEHSYAGHLGKKLEPAIQPLGFDWKIGISLITSFAAREVFVGTMATLYSVGEQEGEGRSTLQEKMAMEKNEFGQPIYTLATGISLMLFYVLAMQCMSTIAVVKRETRSWKWPILQLVIMSSLAYLFSFLAYQLLK